MKMVSVTALSRPWHFYETVVHSGRYSVVIFQIVAIFLTKNTCKYKYDHTRLVLVSSPYMTPAQIIYLLLTVFDGRSVSYGPSFFLLDLWPKREVRGP